MGKKSDLGQEILFYVFTILITGNSPFRNPDNSSRFLRHFRVKGDQGYFLQWKPHSGEMHDYCENSRNFYSVGTAPLVKNANIFISPFCLFCAYISGKDQ